MNNFLKNKSLLWGSIGVVVLVVGIVAALLLIPQEQDTRQQAAVQGGPAKITVTPANLSLAVGETKPAKVAFTTGGKAITNITVVLKYPVTGTTPINAENIVQAPTLPDGWTCGIKQATNTATAVKVSVACLFSSPQGYTSSVSTDLFTFSVKGMAATAANTPAKLAFDTEETVISEVQVNSDTASDIVDFPADLNITVTAAAPDEPAATLNLTMPAPTVSCSANEFTANATIKEGTTPKAGQTVNFSYNSIDKTATTNDQGIATATYTKAATTMNVTATGTGFTPTSVAAPVTIPTDCSTPTETDKRLLMSYDGLSCTNNTFNVTAEAKEDDKLWQDVLITFKYDGQEKTDTTDATGKASVSFPSSVTTLNVQATATDFDSGSISISRPTNCSTSTTTGAACNASCTASRDCATGLTCVSGVCRDSRCTTDASCACADVDVAAQTGTTELPETGFDQTATMAILGVIFLLGGGQLLWSFRANQVTQED